MSILLKEETRVLKRHDYALLAQPKITLAYYIGDNKLAVAFSHGKQCQ